MLINFYWVSILEYFSNTKLRNNTYDATFVIPGASNETGNDLRVKPIVEKNWLSVGNRSVLL